MAKVLGAEKAITPRAPTSSSQPDESRRQFNEADRNYVLGEINRNLDYSRESRRLNTLLREPLTRAEFAETWSGIQVKPGDDALSEVLQKIVDRFKERWANARPIAAQTISSLLIEKNKDE